MPGVIGDPNATSWPVVVGVDAIIERTLCAKDMGDMCSLLIAVETEKHSGGVIRFVGIGEITSSSSMAEGADLGEAKYVLECLQVRGGDVGGALISGLC